MRPPQQLGCEPKLAGPRTAAPREGHRGGSRPLALLAGMRQESATPDAIVARIAAGLHGVVTFEQLLGAGLSPSGISRRVRTGRLHRVHRGVVCRRPPSLSNEARWIAAVFACGEVAALSHRSAAELWALLEPRGGLVPVTVPTAAGRKRQRGIHLHRSPSVLSVTTRRKGIAVTTLARSIADLGALPKSTRSAGRSARRSSTATSSARSERRRMRQPAAGSSAASWRCAAATTSRSPR